MKLLLACLAMLLVGCSATPVEPCVIEIHVTAAQDTVVFQRDSTTFSDACRR